MILEMMSYRVSHHSTSDDSFAYRNRADTEVWRTQDNPLTRLRKWLQRNGVWDDDRENETRARIRKAILDEVKIAENAKKACLSSIFDDVYAELSEEQEEQRSEMKRLMKLYPQEYDIDDHVDGIEGI